MSRWSWHEKIGPHKGIVRRHSEHITAEREEREVRERHEREYDWLEHHPPDEIMFLPTRTCLRCDDEQPQSLMRWIDGSWECPKCYEHRP